MAASSSSIRSLWSLWVDTGGTFTDAVALDPSGALSRAKVLSSSALRARVVARTGERILTLAGRWPVGPDFFAGYELSLLGAAAPFRSAITASTAGGEGVELEGALPGDLAAGGTCEIRSPEEAPVLAARLLTGTRLADPLPEMAVRLATTRGTNALLERKGARTALFITRGFADLLRIGTQQRPELFVLQIVKGEPLSEGVVEVEERLAADGSVLRPLRIEELEGRVRALVAAGIESAAVALLHSYRNPAHEIELGEALQAWGIPYVARSAELAPLIKILPRAETAVVDAYLGPLLERYLSRVADALSGGTLHVMTSAGGLARRADFRAKDSLLSGPAGGVVGAAKAGREAGFVRLVAFDMGGTSTDVARYDGDFDYVFETRIGDAHLVAPALAIESVAAGGGSICRCDGGELQVGPESAGAWPGPACYGAGGPLCLTDVNLLLGRIDPERFEIPLDPAAAERAFATLSAAAGLAGARDELLEGLLRIADERMAEAVRSISLRRGYAPGDYALVAFGGAGGQHACALARLLGMDTVVIPRDAGLLSAQGLGASVVERFAQRQILAPLAEVEERLDGWLAEAAGEAVRAVAAEGLHAREAGEGIDPGEIEVRRRIGFLRYVGQEEALPVEIEPGGAAAAGLAERFAQRYAEVYGYAPEERRIEVESLRVVASSRPPAVERPPDFAAPAPAAPTAAPEQRRCWAGGAWRRVPSHERERLPPGTTLQGPALVFERHSATFVEAGWDLRVDPFGHLVLARREGRGSG